MRTQFSGVLISTEGSKRKNSDQPQALAPYLIMGQTDACARAGGLPFVASAHTHTQWTRNKTSIFQNPVAYFRQHLFFVDFMITRTQNLVPFYDSNPLLQTASNVP